MGISLYGLTPATTYDALIKTGDNAPIDATLKPLSDGVGTNLPMEASTTSINFTGSLLQGGVAVPTAAQVSAKQDTLVSGTNIKTINGTSVLGSGNIVTPTTPPSGVAGAIQFSNGSAFASDAANLFWDNTNKRLGVGTNSPSAKFHAVSGVTQIMIDYGGSGNGNNYIDAGSSNTGFTYLRCRTETSGPLAVNFVNGYASAMLAVKGSGSTSATTSLLVQNSAGSDILRTLDDRSLQVYSTNSQIQIGFSSYWGESLIAQNVSSRPLAFGSFGIANGNPCFAWYSDGGSSTIRINKVATGDYSFIDLYNNTTIGTTTNRWKQIHGDSVFCGVTTIQASAKLQVDSTTQGFLPPRMTTTQKNAITAVAGLVVYDSTTNKLCCYNGSTWNDLF
jgi:hypothetical protein